MLELQWSHNERNGVSNHQRLDCLLNRFLRRRSKQTSRLRVTGLSEGHSPVTGEFPAQRASNAENVSILWRHHGLASQEDSVALAVHNNASVVKPWWPPTILTDTKENIGNRRYLRIFSAIKGCLLIEMFFHFEIDNKNDSIDIKNSKPLFVNGISK